MLFHCTGIMSEMETHILVNEPFPKSKTLSLHFIMTQMNSGIIYIYFLSSYLFDIYIEILIGEI